MRTLAVNRRNVFRDDECVLAKAQSIGGDLIAFMKHADTKRPRRTNSWRGDTHGCHVFSCGQEATAAKRGRANMCIYTCDIYIYLASLCSPIKSTSRISPFSSGRTAYEYLFDVVHVVVGKCETVHLFAAYAQHDYTPAVWVKHKHGGLHRTDANTIGLIRTDGHKRVH